MDFFFFQLAIIFLPGLIWERIASRYGLKRPPTQFEIALRTFTFGLAAYVITFGLYAAAGWEFHVPDVKHDTSFIADKKYLKEYIATIVVSIVGSVLWLYAFNHKLFGRFLRFIKATKKFGDEDLWDFMFNSADTRVQYAYVRDYENNKIFSGWVEGYSGGDKFRELLLRDVQVYDLESRFLYETPLMYLGKDAEKIQIEFPARSQRSGD